MGIAAIIMLGIIGIVARVCTSVERQAKLIEDRKIMEESTEQIKEMKYLADKEERVVKEKVRLLEAKKNECHCAECLGVDLPDAHQRQLTS